MALRGETIGTAYVRVLADGEGFPDSVREQFRDADGAFRQLGRTHSEAYQQGFEDQNEDLTPRMIRGLEAAVRRNSGRFDAIGDQIGGDLFDPIDRQFRHRFGDLVGKQMSKDLREAFFRSGGASDVVDEFIERLESNWEKATRTVDNENRQIAKMMEEQSKRLVEIEDQRAEQVRSIREEEFRAALGRIGTEVKIRKEEEDRQKKALREQQKIERETQAELKKTLRDFAALSRQIGQFHRSLDADRGTRKQFITDLDRLGERVRDLGGDSEFFERDFRRVRIELVRTQPILSRMTNTFDHFGNGVARAFGKGSRNDFFNFFGRLVGTFVSIPGLLTRSAQGIFNFADSFKVAFSEGGMAGVFKKFSVTIVSVTVGLTALAVVMGGVVLIAGVLSSAILSLVGALVAMASTITFAAIGGLTVLAGAFVPVIAGAGIAALAVANMDKETKKAFDGIGKSFKDLGKSAARNIFDSANEDAKAFKKTIEGLKVITDPVSKALGGLLDEFVDSLNDPAFVKFQEFLGNRLPGMVTSLGHIAGNLGTAFIGVFRAITPSIEDFLGWLERITQEFSNWVNSAEGKNSVRDFMDRAKESAQAVGDALGEIIGLIADLFDVSNSEGNDLFTRMADEVGRWRDALQRASEDGTLQQWFEDAGKTARSIGTMVTNLGRFIEKLDTPENRELVRKLAVAFEQLLDLVIILTPVLEAMFLAIINPAELGRRAIAKLGQAMEKVGDAFRAVYNKGIGPVLATFVDAIALVMRKLGQLFGLLASIPGAPDWIGKTARGLQQAADEANGLADEIRNIPEKKDVHVNIITTRLSGHPGASAGGQDVTGSQREIAAANGRFVNVEQMTIITPTEDPMAVAAEVVNRLAAAAYV